MVGAYLRKSPDDKKESDKIENQRKVILDYAERNGLTIGAFYVDAQTSGYTVDDSLAFFDRENYNRMMDDIRGGKLTTVLLKDYTRLGRHAGPFLIAVEQITKYGCKLIDCTGHNEIHPSDDRLIFDAYFSERYVRDISGKVRSLFASKQKDGTLITNNKFGYKKAGKAALIVEEELRACIKLIFRLYIGGLGFEKIARYLNDHTRYPTPSQYFSRVKCERDGVCQYRIASRWQHYHIQNIIGNRVYTGCLVTHKTQTAGIRGKAVLIPESEQYLFPQHHEAIVSADDFDKAQQIRQKRAAQNDRNSAHHDYIFRGLCVCPDCGCHISGLLIKRAKGRFPAYNCSRYIKSGVKGCTNKEIREDVLLAQLKGFLQAVRDRYVDCLASVSLKPKDSKKAFADTETKLKKARRELANLVMQQARAITQEPEQTKPILLEAYQTAEEDCKARIAELTAAAESAQPAKETEPRTALFCLDALIASPHPDRRFLEALLEKVVIHADRTVEFVLKVDITPHSTTQTIQA